MSKFFNTSFMKALLWFIAFIIFAAFIWFIGPLFSYGTLQPLESSTNRIIVISFIASLIVFSMLDLLISLPIVLAICWLIFYASPLITIGSSKPFASEWTRWLLIGTISLVYFIYLLVRLWRIFIEDPERLKRVLQPFHKKKPSLAHKELVVITQKVQLALQMLQHIRYDNRSRGLTGIFHKLFENNRYLYELPWFLVIGAEKSGKTSALINSGITFPVAHQMNADALQNNNGSYISTRNIDFLFSNEAVLIDTAGRYAIQSTDKVANNLKNDLQQHSTLEKADYPPTPDQAAVTSAEWVGVLRILRKERPRMPINGVVLTVDISTLISSSAVQCQQYAEQLRVRMVEARSTLGVQFPIYIVFTKLDTLKGFRDFFHGMNRDSQDQIWGVTFPWLSKQPMLSRRNSNDGDPTKSLTLQEELALLADKLKRSLLDRLHEEHATQRRHQLFPLPEEFKSLTELVDHFLSHLFANSRFDGTIDNTVLRGVYFSSAKQGDAELTVCQTALVTRLQTGLAKQGDSAPAIQHARDKPSNSKSYFIYNIFQSVIFKDKNLARPNLIWETRFKLLRLFLFTGMFGIFFWLLAGVYTSFGNNTSYLNNVSNKITNLEKTAQEYFKTSNLALLAAVMDSLDGVPTSKDFDIDNPPASYTYGLFAGHEIQTATSNLYDFFSLHYLLPAINNRLEQVLRQAIDANDDVATYETLRVYIMLHDRSRYKSTEVRSWALKDYQNQTLISKPLKNTPARNNSNLADRSNRTLAESFGNKTSVIKHIETLFRDDQLVQSNENIKTDLVRRAREILEKKTQTNRIYSRIMSDLIPQSPPSFNILRAVGADASMVFTTIRTETESRFVQPSGIVDIQNNTGTDVPGIYTYNGYHNVFKPNYRAMATELSADDDWVMSDTTNNTIVKPLKVKTKEKVDDLVLDSLQEELLYKYLTEYASQWSLYIDGLDTVSTSTLPHQISVLRTLAEPNSPLVRLSRALVTETTLSRKISIKEDHEKSYLEQAEQKISEKVNTAAKDLGLNQVTKLEQNLVDNKFAALRIVVTGQANTPTKFDPSGVGANAAGSSSLSNIISLVNEYYAALSVVQLAAGAGGIPNNTTEIQTKVAIEASKLPAPLRKILSHINIASTENLNAAMTTGLINKAQPQVDRILGLFTQQVLEPCKRTIAGRYPFANSPQEVSIEDFNSFFALDGTADGFFNKYLLPYVDTSTVPWRYKTPGSKIGVATEADITAADNSTPTNSPNQPTLSAEVLKMLAANGPNPESFSQIGEVRKAFFAKQGEKRMSWSNTLKVLNMDPTILELSLNVDGQVFRYAHGPIQPWLITWPGTRNGSIAEISAQPKIRESSTKQARGPWALFRMLEAGRVTNSASAGQSILEYNFDGRIAQFALSSPDLINPSNLNVLKRFQCPQ